MLGLAYRFGAWLTSACPPSLRYALAGALTVGFYEILPRSRRASRVNYAAALRRPPTGPDVPRVARAAFANYGHMLVDQFIIPTLGASVLEQLMEVDGRRHIDFALRLGRGAVLALPHMGSWDACGALAAIWGYPIVAVAESMPGSLNDEVAAARSKHGLRLLPMSRASLPKLVDALAANELVALVCDLPHGPGVPVTFLDHRAIVPGGPASLAIHCGSPIVPVCSRGLGQGRYHIHVDSPIMPPAPISGRGSRSLATELMQQVVNRFEVFVRENPEHWYAFRDILS